MAVNYTNIRLRGEYFDRAKTYLFEELSLLEEQIHLSPRAEELYYNLQNAISRFLETCLLSDALICANIRG